MYISNKKSMDWKKRKKIGRPKAIASPQVLWKLACDYFHSVDSDPFLKQDFIRGGGSAGTKVELENVRPYTWEGFDNFLFEKGIINRIDDYKYNRDNQYTEYSDIITRVGSVIYDQKFTGAAVGAFNANIIARDLGLADKQELKADVSQVDYSKLSEQALEELAKQADAGSSK